MSKIVKKYPYNFSLEINGYSGNSVTLSALFKLAPFTQALFTQNLTNSTLQPGRKQMETLYAGANFFSVDGYQHH